MPSRIVAIARSRAALAAVFLVAGLVAGPRVERFLSNLRVRVVKVSFEGPANKALAGKVYYPASLLRRPRHGVLFCHGTLPDGKDTAFYRALMKGLARRGYLVFGFDLRGFGKSPLISNIGRPVGLDFTADAKAAIAYMTEQLPVRRDTLTIMGHSLGAAIAFATGATDERVANIIAISAGNFPSPGKYREIDKRDYLAKIKRATGLDIPPREWDRMAGPLALFQHLPLPARKKVLIVLADCDSKAVIDYNRRLYDELNVQKDMLIIPDSNHNFGYEDFPGNERISEPPLRMLTQGIENWLDSICADPADAPPPAG